MRNLCIEPTQLQTAVLFLVFNRLDTTRQVFKAIRKAQPPRLYVAADGARSSKYGEAEKVQAVRDYIMQNIDWECKIKTLFRDQNLGCKYAVSGAITWFFDHEERGIILEDDCMPAPEFFLFCEEALITFKDDQSIGAIGGHVAFCNEEPFLNIHGSIWGWASWRDRWNNYDINNFLDESSEKYLMNELPLYSAFQKINISRNLKTTSPSTWDYQWLFTRIKHRYYTILPGRPLVSNIGFDSENSTHTKSKKPMQLKRLEGVKISDNNLNFEYLQKTNLKKIEKKRMFGRYGKARYYAGTFKILLTNPSVLKLLFFRKA